MEEGAGLSEFDKGTQIAWHLKVQGETKSDTQLAMGLLKGDESAFSEFVNAFHGRLAKYSFLMCGHREDAEEVAQETLFRVFENIEQLHDPGRLKAWVFALRRTSA